MGIKGSKAYCGGGGGGSAASSPSPPRGGNGRCRGSRVFQSSCLGTTSGSSSPVDHRNGCRDGSKGDICNGSSPEPDETRLAQVKMGCCRKVKPEQSDELPYVDSSGELGGWSEARITDMVPRVGNGSARDNSPHCSTSPSRFLSRFSCGPGNVSFRLGRATSIGSSMDYPVPSANLRILTDEEGFRCRPRSANGVLSGNGSQSDSPPDQGENRATSFNLYRQGGHESFGNMLENKPISSGHGVTRDVGGNDLVIDASSHISSNLSGIDGTETRLSDRRAGVREHVQRNVRFSRTLSVGRLRDRVLRRSSVSDLTLCPSQQEREGRIDSQGRGSHAMGGEEMGVLESEGEAITSTIRSGYPSSSMPDSSFSMQDNELDTSRSREARYHDLLEHRSNFLERRRRIRSQVHALQRLGSRFENLSGHERSCILSGQHRTGRCTCRANNRGTNPNDDTSARASISRIVMLAEALFEVLDEIHQQSVVLSSRTSVSSVGSVPAPVDVVDSLPLKSYRKSQKHQSEEAAQCYICLMEYEDGDSMRVLPCHHEFHRACVDKWLKEIHRVCPLCRGDICRSDLSPPES